jgi:hypothetical protein
MKRSRFLRQMQSAVAFALGFSPRPYSGKFYQK